MDINGDGNIDLPELDILLIMIRNKHNIEFVEFVPEEDSSSEESSEDDSTEDDSTDDDSTDDDSADDEVVPSKSDLKKMKKTEVVEVAKTLGLDIKGTKAELIERITQ